MRISRNELSTATITPATVIMNANDAPTKKVHEYIGSRELLKPTIATPSSGNALTKADTAIRANTIDNKSAPSFFPMK